MTTSLTIQLNNLLQAIHLPFTLQSPTDLTPSLLLAILESILNVRIPIDDHNSPTNIIKVFLGVLETDILRADIGLSKIDPRLLADGSWDEVVYVAEVLCWIGQELGLVSSQPPTPHDKGKERATCSTTTTTLSSLDLQPSPSTSQTTPIPTTTPSPSSTITFLPPFTPISPLPTPTLLFTTEDTTTISSPLATSSPFHQKNNLNSNQIHPHSSSSSTQTPIPLDDSSFHRQTPPIRRTGYISLVDHDSELSSFFSRSLSLSTSPSPPRTPTRSKSRHHKSASTSSSTGQSWRTLLATSADYDPRRTYQLLQQRTELMEELLRIRMNQSRSKGHHS